MYQIYILLFTSGHYYIGRSKNYQRRYRHHLHYLRANKHGNCYMQRVYDLHGEPKCILLMHCINCIDVEQLLLNYNHGKDNCVNLSKKANGGSSVTRDSNSKCNIKTKDFSNIAKLLKIIHIDKVAKYYKVHPRILKAICREQKIPYINTYHHEGGSLTLSKIPLDNISEFVLDSYRYTNRELATKYNVNRGTISEWHKKFEINKKVIPLKKVKLQDFE